jgi:hypothetical protein
MGRNPFLLGAPPRRRGLAGPPESLTRTGVWQPSRVPAARGIDLARWVCSGGAEVASEFSASICDRLAPFSEDLTPELYDAGLSGVAMAYGVHRRGAEASRENGTNFREVERLMGGFVSELRKLDETLETLAAYVSRLRTQTGPDDPVH